MNSLQPAKVNDVLVVMIVLNTIVQLLHCMGLSSGVSD